MKEVTRTGSLILKSLNEQKNVIHLKSLLDHSNDSKDKEEGVPSLPTNETSQEETYCTLFASTHADSTANHLSSSYFLSSITPSSPALFILYSPISVDLFMPTQMIHPCLSVKRPRVFITRCREFHQDHL